MARIPGLTERLGNTVYRTAWYPDDEAMGAEQYIVNAIWNLIVLENFPGKVWSDPFAKRAWLRYWRDREAISGSHHPVITQKGMEKPTSNTISTITIATSI